MEKIDIYNKLKEMDLNPQIVQDLELFLINNTNWTQKQLITFIDLLHKVRYDKSMIDQRGQGYDYFWDDEEDY